MPGSPCAVAQPLTPASKPPDQPPLPRQGKASCPPLPGPIVSAGGGAEDVVVAEARWAVAQRPGGGEHQLTGVEGSLPPGIHRRAVGGASHIGPHARPIG